MFVLAPWRKSLDPHSRELALANKTIIDSESIKDMQKANLFKEIFINAKVFKCKLDLDSLNVNTYLSGVDPRTKYTIGDFVPIGNEEATEILKYSAKDFYA